MSNNNGKISIFNNTTSKISATVVKYDYEEYEDIKPVSIIFGDTNVWERYPGRDYFCFLSDNKVLYGFLCRGGKKYEYIGNGQMRLPEENLVYRLENDISPVRNNFRILALLEDVDVSLYQDNRSNSTPIKNFSLRKNSESSMELPDGYYYLKIRGEDTFYGVIPGKAYYIAKGQVVVEVGTNIIKKPHKDSDIEEELRYLF